MVSQRVLRGFDWLERWAILALYGWLVARLGSSYWQSGNVTNLLLLASEGTVVGLILFRRGTSEISLEPLDWLWAVCATIAPLLVESCPGRALVAPSVGAALMLGGLVLQISGKLTLGRSLGCIPAHRGLRLRGPYRLVRHPIYAGYLLSHVAFAIMNPSAWNLGIYGLAYVMQVPRLLAEERLLSRDPRYQEYMAAVRYRLVPGVY